jgi:hypothetical protein
MLSQKTTSGTYSCTFSEQKVRPLLVIGKSNATAQNFPWAIEAPGFVEDGWFAYHGTRPWRIALENWPLRRRLADKNAPLYDQCNRINVSIHRSGVKNNDMSVTEQSLRDSGILDVIRTLASNGESGRLSMNTGTTDGIFFFKNGQLVDARVGNLTGFQAINAAASMPGSTFSFDPYIAPPSFSSITPNERVVLKQFFGIDTAAPEEFHDAEQVIPEEVDEVSEVDEVTLVRPNVPRAAVPLAEVPRAEVPSVLPYPASSSAPYRSGLLVAAVVFLLAVAAVALLYKYGDYDSPAPVASVVTNNEPSSSPVVEQAEPNRQPISQPSVARGNQPSPAPVVAQAEPNNEPTVPAQDLTGKWSVVNTVQKTSYSSFNNMEIGFNLSIEQSGQGFTGKGEKVSENGRSLPRGSRTPIQVQGSINGDRVEATFYEQGTTRKTNGRFVWRINKAGGLSGTFITNAARSSGKSTARKV